MHGQNNFLDGFLLLKNLLSRNCLYKLDQNNFPPFSSTFPMIAKHNFPPFPHPSHKKLLTIEMEPGTWASEYRSPFKYSEIEEKPSHLKNGMLLNSVIHPYY